ncbi:hypothetical protein NSND_62351 [Nitrospira sp. ND1]|nr:hypothetical protein NSND_62351 [Nitrospira sp. ND1]
MNLRVRGALDAEHPARTAERWKFVQLLSCVGWLALAGTTLSHVAGRREETDRNQPAYS